MQSRLAHVGSGVRIAKHFLAQPLELALPNILEVRTFGPLGRRFVKVDRDAVAFPDFASHFLRKHHTIFNRHTFDGNKRHHVGRAHTRVRS